MGSFILALDQGTTSSRAILFDRSGRRRRDGAADLSPALSPQPGWVEHDPMEIWAAASAAWLRRSLRKLGHRTRSIAGIGITNQRETTILWDKTNR